MNHQDYDEDGNNIVPCPICLDIYCPSKEGGKCPKEDEFARDMGAKPTVEGTETEEWDEIAFAKAHSEICTATSPRSERSHREGRKEFSPSDKRHCGKQLYRFLVNNGLELDINHPHNHDNK